MKKQILFIFVVLSIFSLKAQNEMRIVGKGEYLPSELIDKTIRDANGEVCAGLVIVSDLDGLTYTAYNEIVKTNRNPGRDLLFIQREERVVTVYKTGFTPLKIILNDYGIKLNNGEVWQLKITGDKALELIPITLNIVPDQTTVKIDGKIFENYKTVQLAKGKHKITIEKGGFKSIDDEISVSISNIFFSFNLREIDLQPVQLNSEPTGAKIYINANEKGETNKGVFLYPGSYNLRLTKQEYLDKEETIEVKEGAKNSFSFPLIKNSSFMKITYSPKDAKVVINNQDFSGKETIEILSGRKIIEISKNGYFTLIDTVELRLGETLTKNYSLQRNSGLLSITVTPSDAKVLINKETYNGTTSLELSPGKYKIEVSKEGYYETEETIEIELGKTVTKSYTLEPKVGKLQFSVSPPDATVELSRNGKTVQTWQGLKIVKDLQVGEYDLTVKSSGYKTVTKKINIGEDKTTTQDVQLALGSDILFPPIPEVINTYFWGGEESARLRNSLLFGIGLAKTSFSLLPRDYPWDGTSGFTINLRYLNNYIFGDIEYIFNTDPALGTAWDIDVMARLFPALAPVITCFGIGYHSDNLYANSSENTLSITDVFVLASVQMRIFSGLQLIINYKIPIAKSQYNWKQISFFIGGGFLI